MKRIAVIGLGRSGLYAAKAVLTNGYAPTVYDESPLTPKTEQVVKELRELGIEVCVGWQGPLPEETDIVVPSPAIDRKKPILVDAASRRIPIWSEIELAYRISKAPIVAITGTNGKSTTTVMTYLALQGAGERAILCGNIFGSGYEEQTLTQAAADASPDEVLVAEISSFQLEWVERFRPVSAGITRTVPDHLPRYTGFPEYAATKQRIFAAQEETDYAVLPAPPVGTTVPSRPHVMSFGPEGDEARIEAGKAVVLGRELRLSDMQFQEQHNLSNAAMALLLATGYLRWRGKADEGLNPGLLRGLQTFKGLRHRMERLGSKNGVEVINNSMCTNPDAVISSSQAIQGSQRLLIGGSNKSLEFQPVADYLAQAHHHAYLFGRDAPELAKTIQAPTFATMQEAFAAAAKDVQAGETIMLAPGCASQDAFEDFRERGDVFIQVAKEWLNS